MKICRIISIIGMSILICSCGAKDTSHLNREAVVPKPAEAIRTEGKYIFSSNTQWIVENKEQEEIAKQMTELFSRSAGIKMQITKEGEGVRFQTDTTLEAEAYSLQITNKNINIRANSAAGFFYATQSLRQMLPSAIEAREIQKRIEWSVPAIMISDEPRFAYRGFMLDVSRFFMPKENVLKIIDLMGLLKLNKLLLHLVDDQGWRIEIKSHPRLTEIGAWRVMRDEEFPARPAPEKGEPAPVGGFYTQDDIRELVAYAKAKSIEVIPEIEMPAHTCSSLAAYPSLACPVVKQHIGVLPGFSGGKDIVYCAGNDSVFHFLQDVIDEVAELFPSQYIHLGGDEASKVNWEKCPLCQARMKAEKITHVENLQGYFMKRMGDYVRSKGKTIMGWDELTQSTIPEGAVIVGWQGMGNLGYKAGAMGHSYIMAPARKLYLLRYQGPQWFEPRTYFGNNTLSDVYNYEPIKPELSSEVASLMAGVQACLWTEFTSSPEEAEYLIFPRLIAFSEIAWSDQGQRDWKDYLGRQDVLLQHFDVLGINYALSMYNIDHQVMPENGSLSTTLSCIRPDVEIHYTTDGKEPDTHSPLYKESLKTSTGSVIKAATFRNGKQMGKTLTINLNINKATAKTIEGKNKNLHLLINGLKGSDKQSDFEWCGWYGENDSFVVDMWNKEKINRVVLGTILNQGMAAHLPKSVMLYISDNGIDFKEITRQENKKEAFGKGIETGTIEFTGLAVEGRYLKVSFENPGICPEGHVREGQATWVYFDEIEIN